MGNPGKTNPWHTAELQAQTAAPPDQDERADETALGEWRRWSHRAMVAKAGGLAATAAEAGLRALQAKDRFFGGEGFDAGFFFDNRGSR